MNKLEGHITTIETSGNLCIVTAAIAKQLVLQAIVIENPESASYLEKGRAISMLFKETEVIISTGPGDTVSLQNKIPATIKSIEKGALLSKVVLSTPTTDIGAILSTKSVVKLGLREQLEVVAMVKLNEVMISEL